MPLICRLKRRLYQNVKVLGTQVILTIMKRNLYVYHPQKSVPRSLLTFSESSTSVSINCRYFYRVAAYSNVCINASIFWKFPASFHENILKKYFKKPSEMLGMYVCHSSLVTHETGHSDLRFNLHL